MFTITIIIQKGRELRLFIGISHRGVLKRSGHDNPRLLPSEPIVTQSVSPRAARGNIHRFDKHFICLPES